MRLLENLFTRRSHKEWDEGYSRMARVEFFREYTLLSKNLGREPTGRELRDFIG